MTTQNLVLHYFLRKFRFNRGLILKDMADTLSLGVAELSSIEHGKRRIPEDFTSRMRKAYSVTHDEEVHLFLIDRFQKEGSI
ncbi:hypothetical protein C0431_12780 [bacterium]|nr:hypothetical protein [bacterium]